jgi:CTP synthase (UTP-ammonia lyase)
MGWGINHPISSQYLEPTMWPFSVATILKSADGCQSLLSVSLGIQPCLPRPTLLGTSIANCVASISFPQSVLERERRGDYLGKTVQVVPHVTDAIQDWIQRVAHIPVDGRDGLPDVCVIELGGTVGDIESMPFVEALRQFQFKVGSGNMCIVHVSLVPIIGVVGEQKTKPTQHSVAVLRSLGLHPNMLACRCSEPLDDSVRQKLVRDRGEGRRRVG